MFIFPFLEITNFGQDNQISPPTFPLPKTTLHKLIIFLGIFHTIKKKKQVNDNSTIQKT